MRAIPPSAARAATPSGRSPQAVSGIAGIAIAGARKDIRAKADRRWQPSKIPSDDSEEAADEAFARDWTRGCEICGDRPVVNATGMCGPHTFGESETMGGNW